MKKNVSKRWVINEIYKLVRLKRGKRPIKEIAKGLNRSISACQTMLQNIRCGIVPEWKESAIVMKLKRECWRYENEIKNCRQVVWCTKQELKTLQNMKNIKEGKEIIKNTKEEIREMQEVRKKILRKIELMGGFV